MTEVIQIERPTIIPNISNCTFRIENDNLILEPCFITEEKLLRCNLGSSTIINCVVKDSEGDVISGGKNKYQPILTDIWNNMTKLEVTDNTSFSVTETTKKNYSYNKKHGFYYLGKNADGVIEEMIKMIKLNNFSMNIKIELREGELINFKIH
jgi:hypothetical protein